MNGAFRSQRVTGQQRYAIEIADRLIQSGAKEVRPGPFWARTAIRTWLWSLVVLPLRTWDGVLVSLTSRAPVLHPRQVLAVHDLFVLTNPEWYSRSYTWTHVPMLRVQLRSAAAVVAVSQPVAEQLTTSRPASAISLAPNAPSRIFQTAAKAGNVLGRFGLEPSAFLLTIGSLDPRKNLERLAGAWAAVPEETRLSCPLTVVGGSATIYSQREIQWPSGTVLAGYVDDADLVSLYEAAKGVVFVSLAEGFGLPIVEAVAAGVRRLVLSDIEVFRWIAGEGAVFVDPRSMTELTEALIGVIQRPGWPSPAIDVDRFAWEQSAEAVMKVATEVRLR